MFNNLNYLIAFACVFTLGESVYLAKEECPTNEEYLLCGSTCPTNCTNLNPDCSDDCAEGCFCLTGYVRDQNGTCISIDKCPGPSQCGDNEEFVPCATVCPATCRVPEPEVCGAACGMGCFCKDGFYRDERSNKCVTLDSCPAEECPTNEEYLLCGSTCPTNCTNLNPDCSDDCSEGCFCLTGYVRDANGTCISIDKCPGPSQCGDNEEFVPCATVCPATCRVPEPEVCGAACGMGCFCKDGFYRDERSNKCVTLDSCPAEECFNPNEVFDICSAACEPSCADPQPICATLCKSGCICADGFIRGPDGSCVGVDKCPANSTDTNVLKRYLNAITTILHLPTS